MERIRGGRVGLHSALRKLTLNGWEVDGDNPILLVDINRLSVLPSRWMLEKLSRGHSPVSVGIGIFPEDVVQRKLYQLRRAYYTELQK